MKKSLECSTKPAGIDRPALQHLHGLGGLRQRDLLAALDDVELNQQSREIDAARRTVDDDPHRPLGRMRAHVDHGSFEPGIAHDRHGDQQLPVQVAGIGRSFGGGGRLAANALRYLAFRAHP
jgi:hypothetical protein